MLLNPGSLLSEILVYSLSSGVPTFSSAMLGNFGTSPTRVFLNGNITYRYYQSTTSAYDYILVQSVLSLSGTSHTFAHKNASINFSPNYQLAITWTGSTKIYIYNTTNFALLYIFNQSMVGTQYTTSSIKFSSDSTLIVIEADQYTSVKVLNVTNFAVVYSYTISTAVIGAVFLTNDMVLILVQTSNNTLWFLSENMHIPITNITIPADTFEMDFTDEYLFTCYSNSIYSYFIGNLTNTINTTANGTNGTNNANSSNSNSTTNGTNSTTTNSPTNDGYSINLTLSNNQESIYDSLNTTLLIS